MYGLTECCDAAAVGSAGAFRLSSFAQYVLPACAPATILVWLLRSPRAPVIFLALITLPCLQAMMGAGYGGMQYLGSGFLNPYGVPMGADAAVPPPGSTPAASMPGQCAPVPVSAPMPAATATTGTSSQAGLNGAGLDSDVGRMVQLLMQIPDGSMTTVDTAAQNSLLHRFQLHCCITRLAHNGKSTSIICTSKDSMGLTALHLSAPLLGTHLFDVSAMQADSRLTADDDPADLLHGLLDPPAAVASPPDSEPIQEQGLAPLSLEQPQPDAPAVVTPAAVPGMAAAASTPALAGIPAPAGPPAVAVAGLPVIASRLPAPKAGLAAPLQRPLSAPASTVPLPTSGLIAAPTPSSGPVGLPFMGLTQSSTLGCSQAALQLSSMADHTAGLTHAGLIRHHSATLSLLGDDGTNMVSTSSSPLIPAPSD